MDASGRILTNLHLVDGPHALKVTAEVVVEGERVTRTFDRVEIVGAHPQYDAAVIQVDAPGFGSSLRLEPASGS